MPPKAAPQVFMFLDPIFDPSASRTAETRKAVRSHVMVRDHRNRQHQEEQEYEIERARRIADADAWRSRQNQPRDEEGASQVNDRKDEPERESEDEPGKDYRPFITTSIDLSHPSISSFRRGSTAFNLYILNDPSNIIESILEDINLDALFLLDCYQQASRSQAREWEQQLSPLTKPGTTDRFLPYSMFEKPALTASCILVGLYGLHPHEHTKLEPPILQAILRLRGHVMRSINSALDDPARATNELVMFAVMSLALCEAQLGFEDTYPLHMAGLMEMVNLRGGFQALGYDGGAEGFIRWTDVQIAKRVGGKTYSHLVKNPSALPGVDPVFEEAVSDGGRDDLETPGDL